MEEITVRPAVKADLNEIRRIYDTAKRFMNTSGNPNQWVVGYPPAAVLENDIKVGQLYVIADSQTVYAVFALIAGIDPTYLVIESGKWLSDRHYATLHRVASDGRIHGVLDRAVAYAKSRYPDCDLRIDTHADNKPMQAAIRRNGFAYCGVIHLPNGEPRWAYLLERGKTF